MFGKKHSDNGEKIYRYSIRKYHFGAASVAVAALMFFANGVQAQAPAVSPVTASDVVAGPSGNSDGDSQGSDEESPEKTEVVEQPVELKSAGESSTPEAKTEEGSQEESEAEVKSPQPETKIDENAEAPQVAKEKDQEVSAPVADTSAAKSTQSTLEALLANLTLDSMKALHTEVEGGLAKAKAVLENPKATQAQVDEQVRLMEDLIRRVREALSPQVSTPPVLEKAGLTNTRLAAPEGTVLTPKEAVTKVLEKNPVASTNGEVSTPSTELSKPEVSDSQNKDKLKTISKDLSAYLIQANEITRPETKKLLEGVEEVVKSIEASVLQPQLTPAEIEELLKKGKQAERKLALALTRENSGKRDLLNGKTMKTGSDFRASSATEDLNTIRAYIAKGGTVTTNRGNTFVLPKETYLYALIKGSDPGYPYNDGKQANVGTVIDEASITVKKDDRDPTGKTFIWDVYLNHSNLSHQNAFYWFTLPKGHTMGKLLGATRTSNGNRSYGTDNLDSEWRNKIKDHLTLNKTDFGSALNHPFERTFDSITDVTDTNYIAGKLQRADNNKNNNYSVDGRAFYYLGNLYRPRSIAKVSGTGVSEAVIDKANRNLDGLKEHTDKLYFLKYDGAGSIRLTYTTTTETPYAPLYYGSGMRSYEYSSSKLQFMARGLQEKPATPKVTPNNEGTVTVTPYADSDQHKNVDKVELSYTNARGESKTATLTRNAKDGTWTSSGNGADGVQINGNSFSLKAGSVKVGTDVTAKSYFGNSDASDNGTERIRQRTATPGITANQDGSVTVTPKGNADYLTVKYTEESNNQNTVITANKQGSTWTVTGGTNVTIDKSHGTITIPANSVKDGSTVEAQAKATDEFISDKVTVNAKNQDRTAPTIRVRKNGTTTWLTPKDGVVTVVATPERTNVELDVDIKDETNGSGYDFSANGNNPTAMKTVENSADYNENSTTYSVYGKAADATAKLTVGLKPGKTTTDFSGITMKLNAKDNAGNITNATNKREVTVKIISAKPTYPEKFLVGNPDNIKDREKDAIIKKLEEANRNHPAGAPTFTKGVGEHANDIVATYSDGTTYYVPLSDVTKYEIKSKFPKGTKDLTFISGEAGNDNWGHSRDYFTYGDGTAISDSRWSSTLDDITRPFANASLTVGNNKTIEVTGPDGNGSTKKYTIDYRVVDAVTPKNSMYTVKGKDFVKPNTTTAAVASDFYNNTDGKTIQWKANSAPDKNAAAGQNHTATATVTYSGVDRNGQTITREVTTNYTTVNTVLVKNVFAANQGGKLTTGNDSEASSYTQAETGQKTHIQREEFVATSRTTVTAPSTAKAGSLNKEIQVTYDNGQTQNLGLVVSVTPSAPTITSDLHDKAGLTNQTITVSNVPEDGTV